MAPTLFYLFALFTVVCAVGTVMNKNAVNAAMCFLLCLVGVAGLFVQAGGFKKFSVVAALVALGLLVTGLGTIVTRGQLEAPNPNATSAVGAALKPYAYQLFTTYLLPVQVMGFLLLIAMLGVIVLSKKMDGLEDIK